MAVTPPKLSDQHPAPGAAFIAGPVGGSGSSGQPGGRSGTTLGSPDAVVFERGRAPGRVTVPRSRSAASQGAEADARLRETRRPPGPRWRPRGTTSASRGARLAEGGGGAGGGGGGGGRRTEGRGPGARPRERRSQGRPDCAAPPLSTRNPHSTTHRSNLRPKSADHRPSPRHFTLPDPASPWMRLAWLWI